MLKRSTLQFDIGKTEQALDAQQQAFSQDDFKKTQGCQAPDPIFIVGLPRAGSTLLEQILASHSNVDGTMELHDILGIASSLSHQSTPYPFNISALSEETLSEQYIQQTRAYHKGTVVIDKILNNFIHIGLIKRYCLTLKLLTREGIPWIAVLVGTNNYLVKGRSLATR